MCRYNGPLTLSRTFTIDLNIPFSMELNWSNVHVHIQWMPILVHLFIIFSSRLFILCRIVYAHRTSQQWMDGRMDTFNESITHTHSPEKNPLLPTLFTIIISSVAFVIKICYKPEKVSPDESVCVRYLLHILFAIRLNSEGSIFANTLTNCMNEGLKENEHEWKVNGAIFKLSELFGLPFMHLHCNEEMVPKSSVCLIVLSGLFFGRLILCSLCSFFNFKLFYSFINKIFAAKICSLPAIFPNSMSIAIN